jgi:hypothetical protein
MIQKVLSGISFCSLWIPITTLILSAISFQSCPSLAMWIIVFSSIAIVSLLVDIVLRLFTYDDNRTWIPYVIYIIMNCFFLGWDGYGIYLLVVNQACNIAGGWAKYNYVAAALILALDLVASLLFLIAIARNVWVTRGTAKPDQIYA